MNLGDIYQPIADDLREVECLLEASVKESENQSILAMSDCLLESGGKRLRPGLVILSGKAASDGEKSNCDQEKLITLATAVELIHMASLIHDDVLDGADMRRNRPSINAKFGDDVSIIFADYIYVKAFKLIGKCKNSDVFECILHAIDVMCEGELTQIYQRGKLDLSRDDCLDVAKRKTALLFAACCESGSIIGKHSNTVQGALKEFGLNFGMAFQIIDDCNDIISEERSLGKYPGQDIAAGDITMPILDLLETAEQGQKEELKAILNSNATKNDLEKIRRMFIDSEAMDMSRKTAFGYISCAKQQLSELEDSAYKRSLDRLTDYVVRDFVDFVES